MGATWRIRLNDQKRRVMLLVLFVWWVIITEASVDGRVPEGFPDVVLGVCRSTALEAAAVEEAVPAVVDRRPRRSTLHFYTGLTGFVLTTTVCPCADLWRCAVRVEVIRA